MGEDIGSLAAGAASNKIAEGYMNEMVETSLALNNQEKLNDRIFKYVAQSKGVDPNTVRGTGWTREFVPEYLRGDICDRPDRNARPES